MFLGMKESLLSIERFMQTDLSRTVPRDLCIWPAWTLASIALNYFTDNITMQSETIFHEKRSTTAH